MEHLDTKPFETNDPFLFDEEIEPLYEVSKTKRFLNYVIDVIAFYALGIAIVVILIATGNEAIVNGINDTLFGLIIIFAYYWGFESIFGQTVGKMITGCVVVTEDGESITPMDAFKRTLCRLIPFEAFSFLGSGPGWHDTISKTRVVKK